MRIISSALLLITLSFILAMPGYSVDQDNDVVSAMTFNIRYGTANDGENHWDLRKEYVVDVVKTYKPDIIGWQEMLDFQRDYMRDGLQTYGVFGIGREIGGGGEGCYIFFNNERFELLEGGNFWLSETPGVPGSVGWDSSLTRICTWVRLMDKVTLKPLYVYNTHFDHIGVQMRLESAKLILQRISMQSHLDPVILMGDLNSIESSEPVLFLSGTLTETFREINPDAVTYGTFNGFVRNRRGEKIDYVFVDELFDVLDSGIIYDEYNRHTPSDHYPVWCEILQRDF